VYVAVCLSTCAYVCVHVCLRERQIKTAKVCVCVCAYVCMCEVIHGCPPASCRLIVRVCGCSGVGVRVRVGVCFMYIHKGFVGEWACVRVGFVYIHKTCVRGSCIGYTYTLTHVRTRTRAHAYTHTYPQSVFCVYTQELSQWFVDRIWGGYN